MHFIFSGAGVGGPTVQTNAPFQHHQQQPMARPPPVGFNPAAAATSPIGPGQGFHQQPLPPQGMMQHPPPPVGGGGGMMPMPPPGVGVGGGPQPSSMEIFQENIDHSIQVPKRILQLTNSYIPSSANLAHMTKVPLGAVIRPLAPCKPEEEDVKVVQPGAAGIVRCKR